MTVDPALCTCEKERQPCESRGVRSYEKRSTEANRGLQDALLEVRGWKEGRLRTPDRLCLPGIICPCTPLPHLGACFTCCSCAYWSGMPP